MNLAAVAAPEAPSLSCKIKIDWDVPAQAQPVSDCRQTGLAAGEFRDGIVLVNVDEGSRVVLRDRRFCRG